MDALSLLLSRFVISAGVFHTGRICGLHSFEHDDLGGHLHVIEQGPVTFIDAQGTRRIEVPTLLFLPRPEPHSLVVDEPGGAQVVCATVRFGGASRNPISDSLPALVSVALRRLDGSAPLLDLIGQEARVGGAGAQVAVDRICELLMIRLLRHCLAEGITTGGALAGLSDARLAQALAALHRDPTRGWDLAGMAAEAGMSRARFAARFREVTGETPADYLASWRMTVAQGLLRRGRPMKQVSLESGYGSSSAFVRAFSRRVGMPPSRWLKQLESGEAKVPPADTQPEAETVRAVS